MFIYFFVPDNPTYINVQCATNVPNSYILTYVDVENILLA
jgi:hypothetical protein